MHVYVNAALVIKQVEVHQAEELLLREKIPRKVIERVLRMGQPIRTATPSSWAQQFSR